MNTTTKLLTVALSFVLSFGIFFTGNTSTLTSTKSNIGNFTDDFRRERVCIDGIWYIIVYGPDGGIVEVIIDNRD
ncbi:MAG: hypothetical protein NTU73_15540 [Ignavibacteriae bacterium]|nr:hypothetical protein [Ignavibacteriota bacterium]